MIEFLIPIFQSLIASVIYGVGVVAIDVAVHHNVRKPVEDGYGGKRGKAEL